MNIASTFNLATAPVTAEVVRPCIPRDRVNFIDPFAPDSPADQMVVTTERRLLRLSILAAEAALRMKRDGSRSGVESWLLEPRESPSARCGSGADTVHARCPFQWANDR